MANKYHVLKVHQTKNQNPMLYFSSKKIYTRTLSEKNLSFVKADLTCAAVVSEN